MPPGLRAAESAGLKIDGKSGIGGGRNKPSREGVEVYQRSIDVGTIGGIRTELPADLALQVLSTSPSARQIVAAIQSPGRKRGLSPLFARDRSPALSPTKPAASLEPLSPPSIQMHVPPMLTPFRAGLIAAFTGFFGFMREALGGPALDLVRQGQESPVRMKEGVPEAPPLHSLPPIRDSIGSTELQMIGNIVVAAATPYMFGKLKQLLSFIWNSRKWLGEVYGASSRDKAVSESPRGFFGNWMGLHRQAIQRDAAVFGPSLPFSPFRWIRIQIARAMEQRARDANFHPPPPVKVTSSDVIKKWIETAFTEARQRGYGVGLIGFVRVCFMRGVTGLAQIQVRMTRGGVPAKPTSSETVEPPLAPSP